MLVVTDIELVKDIGISQVCTWPHPHGIIYMSINDGTFSLSSYMQFKEFHDRASAFSPDPRITHLLWAKGAHWKSVRNAMSPAFSTVSLSRFIGHMTQAADRIVGAACVAGCLIRRASARSRGRQDGD